MGGWVIVLSESTIPRVGFRYLWAIPVFAFFWTKSKMATPVVSLPVPAVVGIAINGFKGPGTGLPSPIGALTYFKNSAG